MNRTMSYTELVVYALTRGIEGVSSAKSLCSGKRLLVPGFSHSDPPFPQKGKKKVSMEIISK